MGGLNEVAFPQAPDFFRELPLTLKRTPGKLPPVTTEVNFRLRNGHMLDHRGAENDVEILVREWKLPTFWDSHGLEAEPLLCLLQSFRIDVGNRHILAERKDGGDMGTVSTAQIQILSFSVGCRSLRNSSPRRARAFCD